MSATMTQAGLLALNNSWNGSDGLSTSYVVRLYSNDVTPTQVSVPSDFTTCNFTGYTDQGWSSDDNGPNTIVGTTAQIILDGGPFSWECSGAPQTVYGYLVMDGTKTILYAAERFATPQVLLVGTTITLSLTAQAAQG